MKANDYDHASELLKALIHVTGIACDHPNRPVSLNRPKKLGGTPICERIFP